MTTANKTKRAEKQIHVRFFCGHFEQLNASALDTVTACAPFKINDQWRAEASEYCLACSHQH